MWYSASLLFKGVHDIEPTLHSVWEEAIFLIDADSEEEAQKAAQALGHSKEHEYYVSEPQRHLLKWVFVQVERICGIDEGTPRAGTELFSRFLRQSEAESLLRPFEDERGQLS